mgnify:CR=1 FL=1
MKTAHPSNNDFARAASAWEHLRGCAIAKAYLHPSMIAANLGAEAGLMAAGLAPLVQQVHVLDASAEMLAVAQSMIYIPAE